MSAETVETQVQYLVDHLAAYKSSLLGSISGRGSVWDMVDDAEDAGYENIVKGSNMTAVDTAMDNIQFGSSLSPVFTLHQAYYAQAGLTGVTGFGNAFLYYRKRVGKYFNDFFSTQYNTNVASNDLDYVWPVAGQTLLTVTQTGASAGTAANAADLDQEVAGYGRIGAYAGPTFGGGGVLGSNAVITVTVKHFDDTTTNVAVTMTAGDDASDAPKTVGIQALSSNATLATGTVPVAATGQFKVGQFVLLSKGTTAADIVQELAEIVTVNTNTSLIVKKVGAVSAGLREDRDANPFTTANSASVIPLYKGITALVSVATGTASDLVTFKSMDDRPISITY